MAKIRDRVDPRPILVFGLLADRLSRPGQMSGWTTEVRAGRRRLGDLHPGLRDRRGLGAAQHPGAVPKLDKRVQDQGFALFYLSFDVGSAVGTAAVIGLHARHSQINQAILNEAINPYNELARAPELAARWSIFELEGLAALQLEIARQATMIAYNNSLPGDRRGHALPDPTDPAVPPPGKLGGDPWVRENYSKLLTTIYGNGEDLLDAVGSLLDEGADPISVRRVWRVALAGRFQ